MCSMRIDPSLRTSGRGPRGLLLVDRLGRRGSPRLDAMRSPEPEAARMTRAGLLLPASLVAGRGLTFDRWNSVPRILRGVRRSGHCLAQGLALPASVVRYAFSRRPGWRRREGG